MAHKNYRTRPVLFSNRVTARILIALVTFFVTIMLVLANVNN